MLDLDNTIDTRHGSICKVDFLVLLWFINVGDQTNVLSLNSSFSLNPIMCQALPKESLWPSFFPCRHIILRSGLHVLSVAWYLLFPIFAYVVLCVRRERWHRAVSFNSSFFFHA